MSVDDRAARAPGAVPDEEIVAGGRIIGAGGGGPFAPDTQHVADQRSIEGERVVPLEHDHAVVALTGRGVGAGHRMRAADTSEPVCGRAGRRVAERIAFGCSDLSREVRCRCDPVDGPSGTQRGEGRRCQRDAIRDADQCLMAHRVDRAEVLGEPRVHLGRWIGDGVPQVHLEEALRPRAGGIGQSGHTVGKPEDRRLSRCRGLRRWRRAARAASRAVAAVTAIRRAACSCGARRRDRRDADVPRAACPRV